MLPQGVTIVFADSNFSADIRDFSIESARGDFELSTFDDVYRAMNQADLVESTLSMTVSFDPDLSPPIDQDVERIDVTWLKSGTQTRGPLWYFDGYFTSYNPDCVVDGLMEAQVEIKITGPITYRTGTRGCRVAPSGQADYLSSTEVAKLRYGWIADNADQLMSDDTDPYLIMPRGSS